jgi:hypothetical protein
MIQEKFPTLNRRKNNEEFYDDAVFLSIIADKSTR